MVPIRCTFLHRERNVDPWIYSAAHHDLLALAESADHESVRAAIAPGYCAYWRTAVHLSQVHTLYRFLSGRTPAAMPLVQRQKSGILAHRSMRRHGRQECRNTADSSDSQLRMSGFAQEASYYRLVKRTDARATSQPWSGREVLRSSDWIMRFTWAFSYDESRIACPDPTTNRGTTDAEK